MTVRAQQQDTEHAERCNPLRSVAVANQEEPWTPNGGQK